jgi:hypothetical protein
MTKTIITPKNGSYNLAIPEEYIGKQVEILLYSLDEVAEEKKVQTQKTMGDFWGILSESDYQLLKQHTEQARKEWNRNI